MKRILSLSVFPLIGLALLMTALAWSGRDLRLLFQGQVAEGRIVGMTLQRDGRSDLLTGVDTKLTLKLADGSPIEARYRNYAPDNEREISDPPPSPELRRVLADAVRGDAEIIRWALLRESRRPGDPRRVVRIEKTETIHGYFDLETIPTLLESRDGHIMPSQTGGGSLTPSTAVIRAVFDFSNPQAVAANKGESLVEYEYSRNGAAFTPEKKNFFLNAEPYTTKFLPVFGFEVNGDTIARLSHIGRHGGPTLALRLYEKCMVYYDPNQPAEAILMAVPGPVNGDPLIWFSRLCEGFFGQWGSSSLIALAGLGFVITGALFISLAVWPGKPVITTP